MYMYMYMCMAAHPRDWGRGEGAAALCCPDCSDLILLKHMFNHYLLKLLYHQNIKLSSS